MGAFNANNLEIVQAIIGAATSQRSPVIVQASQGALKYAGLEQITAMVKTAARGSHVPVCLHLDHGTDFDQVMRCIHAGFSSVMIDASAYPLADNIDRVKQVVAVARAVGVSVEAELGRIGGTEEQVSVSEREAFFTDPQEAALFVKETGVDALAVAIGTAHGPYKGEPKLDLQRLEAIRALTQVPIVLHGASGVPADSIRGNRAGCADQYRHRSRQTFTPHAAGIGRKPQSTIREKFPVRRSAKQAVAEKIRLFLAPPKNCWTRAASGLRLGGEGGIV